ncbi:MAG: hypothetical protein IJ048_14315 [Clostridia bacterium]|nr:hypothetical protein [Clostridia bacterium]
MPGERYGTGKYRAGPMALDERRGVLYLTSGTPKALSFPDGELIRAFSKMKYSHPWLSDDGKYLALYGAAGHMEIYDTANLDEPLFRKKWPWIKGAFQCFWHGHALIFAVWSAVYVIDVPSLAVRVIYGPEKEKYDDETWHQNGHIPSMDLYEDELIIQHRRFETGDLVSRVNASDGRLIDTRSGLSADRGLFHDGKGGYYLARWDEMRHFTVYPDDFDRQGEIVPLGSDVLAASATVCFSHDRRYASVGCGDLRKATVTKRQLYRTADWTIADEISHAPFGQDSFSIGGRYWMTWWTKNYIVSIE